MAVSLEGKWTEATFTGKGTKINSQFHSQYPSCGKVWLSSLVHFLTGSGVLLDHV